MNTPTQQSPPAPDREARRRARVQLIRDAAAVRRALGQGALHELVGGLHVITYRGERFIGPTVDAAIDAAVKGRR